MENNNTNKNEMVEKQYEEFGITRNSIKDPTDIIIKNSEYLSGIHDNLINKYGENLSINQIVEDAEVSNIDKLCFIAIAMSKVEAGTDAHSELFRLMLSILPV